MFILFYVIPFTSTKKLTGPFVVDLHDAKWIRSSSIHFWWELRAMTPHASLMNGQLERTHLCCPNFLSLMFDLPHSATKPSRNRTMTLTPTKVRLRRRSAKTATDRIRNRTFPSPRSLVALLANRWPTMWLWRSGWRHRRRIRSGMRLVDVWRRSAWSKSCSCWMINCPHAVALSLPPRINIFSSFCASCSQSFLRFFFSISGWRARSLLDRARSQMILTSPDWKTPSWTTPTGWTEPR